MEGRDVIYSKARWIDQGWLQAIYDVDVFDLESDFFLNIPLGVL